MIVHLDEKVLVVIGGHFLASVVDIHSVLVGFYCFAQPVETPVDSVKNKVHEFSAHGIVHIQCFAQVECHVVFEETVVVVICD